MEDLNMIQTATASEVISSSSGSSANDSSTFFNSSNQTAKAIKTTNTNNSESPLVHADDNKLAVQARAKVGLFTNESKSGDSKTTSTSIQANKNEAQLDLSNNKGTVGNLNLGQNVSTNSGINCVIL
jgi:hypothetical protein